MFLPLATGSYTRGLELEYDVPGMKFWGLSCWGFALLLGFVGLCLLLHLGTFDPHSSVYAHFPELSKSCLRPSTEEWTRTHVLFGVRFNSTAAL